MSVDDGATISVRSLSPPELGLARGRHLKWPKAHKSDFRWEREQMEPAARLTIRHHDSSHGEPPLAAMHAWCDPSRLDRPLGRDDGIAADGSGDEPAAGDLGREADQARPAHLVALLDGERVAAVAQAASEHAGKGGGGRAGRGIFRNTHAGREHAGMKMVTGLDGLV